MKEMPGAPGYWADESGEIWSSVRGPLRKLKLLPNIHGYLQFYVRIDGRAVTMRVHKAVALTYHGPRPEGKQVRHLDGNQRNNAPSNLAYGTGKENAADRKLHGTNPDGERSPSAKLTAIDVATIRERLRAGVRGRALACEYGVNETTISWIKTGKHWSDLAGTYPIIGAPCLRGDEHGSSKLRAAQVIEIKRALRAGISPWAISKRYEISPGAIQAIRDGRSWKHVTEPMETK